MTESVFRNYLSKILRLKYHLVTAEFSISFQNTKKQLILSRDCGFGNRGGGRGGGGSGRGRGGGGGSFGNRGNRGFNGYQSNGYGNGGGGGWGNSY